MKTRLLLFCTLTVAGMGTEIPDDYDSLAGIWKLKPALDHQRVVSAMGDAEEIVVYEGLPHPASELELLRREASRKDVVWFHDIPFYSSPIHLGEKDRDEVFAFLKAPFSRPKQTGDSAKFCGGFHADYCIVFRKGERSLGVMFCFGCLDLIAFTEEAYWFPAGTEKREGWKALRETMFRYGTNRPRRKSD